MESLISELKARARILHRQTRNRDPQAIERLRRLPELRRLDEEALVAQARRRHCLAALARELGFGGWPHAATVLGGGEADDFGTLLYPSGAEVHWNIWCASYDEARRIHHQHGGFLLAYRKHFFITDRHFIETLGLDPEDPDWDAIGRDWARPDEPEARQRLYARLIRRKTFPVTLPTAGPEAEVH